LYGIDAKTAATIVRAGGVDAILKATKAGTVDPGLACNVLVLLAG
jgi:hypothetical protein